MHVSALLLHSKHMLQYFWCRLTPLASVVVLFWWSVLFVACVFWAGGPMESLWREMVSQRNSFYFNNLTWTWCRYTESNATVASHIVSLITYRQRITVCHQTKVLLQWGFSFIAQKTSWRAWLGFNKESTLSQMFHLKFLRKNKNRLKRELLTYCKSIEIKYEIYEFILRFQPCQIWAHRDLFCMEAQFPPHKEKKS